MLLYVIYYIWTLRTPLAWHWMVGVMTEEENLEPTAAASAKDRSVEPVTEEEAVNFAVKKLTTIADAYDKLDSECPGCGKGL